jgi:hypothetical protein
MQHFWYNPIGNQEDALISPNIVTNGASNLFLKFDRAYEDINSTPKQDTLLVHLSIDCGETWPFEVYRNWGANLATIDTINLSFTPTLSHHWVTDSIDLSGFAANPSVMVKFTTINRKGQNLYIDNVRIYETQDPVDLTENTVGEITIYPNPSDGVFNLMFQDDQVRSIEIYELSGKLVRTKQTSGSRVRLDLSDCSPGYYMIKIGDHTCSIILK